MPSEQAPINVTEAALNPPIAFLEVRIDGLSEALLVLRIQHHRLGHVDAILSRPTAMFVRDKLSELLAQTRFAA